MSQAATTKVQIKVIPSFSNYAATEDGHIISLRKNIVLKTHLTHKGYLTVNLYSNGVRSIVKVHRAIMEAFHGASLMQVNHKDGIKTNNNVNNLEYTTNAQNYAHGIANNLILVGEKHNLAKLKDKEIIQIRKLKGVLTRKEVADLYNISLSYVSDVWNNKVRITTTPP